MKLHSDLNECAVPKSVTEGKIYQWSLEIVVDPTPGKLAHWVYQELQNNKKHTKYTIPWLLLSVIAKMKIGFSR